MSAEDNKAIVRHFIEAVMNQGDLDVLDQTLASIYASIPLWPNPKKPSDLASADDLQTLRRGMVMIRTALPDSAVTIGAITADGDTVMVCTTTRGTHTGGPFFDIPPTGKAVQYISFFIHRLAGGKIVETRWLWDRLGAWQQLGIVPDQDALHRMRASA